MEGYCLLYGANGYTGQLIARLGKAAGLPLVLAGRNPDKLRPLAEELGLEYRAFDLGHAADLAEHLQGFSLVLHAAGPFIHTARPMMEACMAAGVHYLDITGEIPVFELGARLGSRAKEAGVMLLPGAGFDVVPTDCLALHLKNRLPDATALQLAFATIGGTVSHGTATTMVENLGRPGAVRRKGDITPVPVGYKTMTVPFKNGLERFAMTIPWGDVSTAYYSTGIPNIETYMAVHPGAFRQMVRAHRYLGWLLRSSLVRQWIKRRIRQRPAGPTDEQRATAQSYVWGRVRNDAGEERIARLALPEGYTLTALTSIIICQKVLAGQAPTGFQTPAKAYGADLILEAAGTRREDLL
jgi:short subunit dehydrogenase-like uncharacterized protein